MAAGYNAGVQTAPGVKRLAGRYRLGELLGRGGMAEVFDGWDERLERAVAIKLLRPEMAARPDVRHRFEIEARSAACLSHPNVVAVYDTGEDDGDAYIVMERLPGETLADRLAAGPADPDWVRTVAADVLAALAAAHAAGICHRDVKPANILLAADGRAKVADFGIAKSVEVADADLTGTNQLVGTPAYVAPERIDGRPATARSDLYALGVVLYEALAGSKPFGGDTPLAVAYAVRHGDVTPLRDVRPEVPEALAAAVHRAMERDPDRRFSSAAEMAGALGLVPVEVPTGDHPTVVAAPPDGSATRVMPATTVAGAIADEPTSAAATAAVDAGTPAGTPAGAAVRSSTDPAARRRAVLVMAAVLGLVLLALVLAAGRGGDDAAVGRSGDASTTAESPLAARLRQVAGGLDAADGSRAADAAARLHAVAGAVDAGDAGAQAAAATALLRDVAGWRQSGQLSAGATSEITAALLQVAGANVAALAPTTTARPAQVDHDDDEGGEGGEGGKGKGKDGKGRDD